MTRFALLALSALLLVPALSEARTWRVTPGGELSLSDALHRASAGDVILLAPGEYEGGLWVESSGEPGRPITVRGDGPLGSVVLRGGDEGLSIGDGAHDLVFERLEVRDTGDNLVHVQGGAHRITLRDLRVHDAGENGDGVKVNQAHDVTIERVECFHPGIRPDRPDGNPAQECIDLLDVERAVVQDCYLHDGGNMLLYAKGASRDVVFQRNVIARQGPEAIDPCVGVGAASDEELLRGRPYEAEYVVVRNNVIAGCGAGAVGVYDARHAWVVHNTVLDSGPEVVQFRAGNGPRAESRDVLFANNLVADRGGRMERAFALRSHGLEGFSARGNVFWNGARPVPRGGLMDPGSDADGACADPGLAGWERAVSLGDRDGLARACTPSQGSVVLDRAVELSGAARVEDDLFGRARPAGGRADVGAVEAGAGEARVAPSAAVAAWPSGSPTGAVAGAGAATSEARGPGAAGAVRGGGPVQAHCARGCGVAPLRGGVRALGGAALALVLVAARRRRGAIFRAP